MKRIELHPLDDPEAQLPFSRRLAQENGWPYDYALRVIAEYRRFVYLACISDGEVTPSDEVDQAWHLHLAYSYDYWLTFCEKVLNQPLHHGPTKGGDAEEARYQANYARTLKLYGDVFGEAPPTDIWPPAAIRFDPGQNHVRVNRALFEVKPKSGLVRPKSLWSLLFSAIVLSVFWIIVWEFIRLSFDRDFTVILIGILVLLWLSILKDLLSALRRLRRGNSSRIMQPQHGYRVEYGVTIGVAGGEGVVASVRISGDGAGEGGVPGGGSGGGGCGSGCSGCGGD